MTFPPFTNLSALAAELEKTGKHRHLRLVLNQAWRAQSCLGDLMQANDCCDVLRPIADRKRTEDTHELRTSERALLTMAVILYARATSTSGQKGERGSIQLERGKLSPEQWKDHSALLGVRNQALAHVYSSQPVSDHVWHRELFFAVEEAPSRWRAASASNQTSFHRETLNRLERMIPVGRTLVLEKFQKRMRAVTSEINSADIRGLMQKHLFDPVRAFGGADAVQTLLDGRSTGEAFLWSNE